MRLQKAILGEIPWTPELKKFRRELDSAIDRSVALEPFTVSRWAPLETFGVGKVQELYSLRGSSIEHRPYIATADKPSGVKTGSGRVQMRVYVPAGSGLAPVWGTHREISGQREVLLLRGGMLDIVNVRSMPDGSPLVLPIIRRLPMSSANAEKAYDYREDPEYWRAPFDFTKPTFDVNTPEGGCELS